MSIPADVAAVRGDDASRRRPSRKNVTTHRREMPIAERDREEPTPWYDDEDISNHFEEKTGQQAEDYTP